MTGPMSGDRNYEHALRVIGRHLDSETGFHAGIEEVEGGFTVHFQPIQGEERTSDFAWDRLDDLLIFNSAGRGIGAKRKRNAGLWAEIQGGREDIFRALGHMLDEDQATRVTVDELDDGLAVSYLRPASGNGGGSEERQAVLTIEQLRDIQATAQARRNKATESA